MNTSTRASFRDANHAHASTARGPLLRPEGVVMPSISTQHGIGDLNVSRLRQEQMAFWQENPTSHCKTLAVAYREALNEPEARLPVTSALITSARRWLHQQYAAVVNAGYCPVFLPGSQPLEAALLAFSQPLHSPHSRRVVPVSSDNNDPHPVWSPLENLLFRFVHDYTHFTIGAPATFEGELAVARHTITPAVREDEALARFLASESVAQVALSIVDGTYPKQVLAYGILELI